MKIAQSQVKQEFRLNNNKSSGLLNCLVTGFDPFENQPFNPSEELVNNCPESVFLSGTNVRINLSSIVLPTCGEKAWTILEPILDEMRVNKKPCLIVMFGLAALRPNISLERFALNIRDGERKDNYGHVYNGQVIHGGAPEAMRTNAPIQEAVVYLGKKGLPADISNFCGTYVCNEIYYRVLSYFEKVRVKNCVNFVHLPLPKSYGKVLTEKGKKNTRELAHGKKKQLEAMQLVLTNLVEFYAEALL
jgi:pyroglutamyl-peptidase